nr:hypothetical protein [Cellulosimicrobium sp. CUA-896]
MPEFKVCAVDVGPAPDPTGLPGPPGSADAVVASAVPQEVRA